MANPWDPISDGEEPSSSSEAPTKPRAEWKDLPKNSLRSIGNLAESVVAPILHPIETYKGLESLVTDPEARAAVGQFYKDRYGGLENVRNTLITDPLGLASDVASILTLGSGAAVTGSKVLGVAGKAGAASKAAKASDVLSKVSNFVDPVGLTAKGLGWAGKGVLGFTTGAGPNAIGEAYKAGQKGQSAFRQEQKVRGANLKRDIISDFDGSLSAAQQAASNAYKTNFPQPTFDLPTQSILSEFDTAKAGFAPKTGSRNPQWKITKSEQKKLGEIESIIKGATVDARGRPGLRDIDELDALKQRLFSEYKALPNEGSAAPKAAINKVTAHIGELLRNKHPKYAAVMDRYAEAKDLIDDAKTSLGNQNTAVDTKLSRLRKVLRNSPRGERNLEIVNRLEEISGKPIKARLAGDALSDFLPNSYLQKFGRTVGPVAGVGSLAGGAALAANFLNPVTGLVMAATAPLFSPRAVGIGAYYSGKASKYAGPVQRTLTEAGQVVPVAESAGPQPWDPVSEPDEQLEQKAVGGLASLKKRYG